MKNSDDKKELYFWGGLLGLGLGVISAYFYGRAREENADDSKIPAELKSGDIVKFALLLLGVVRQIAEFGASTGRKAEE